jgi:hypothetical protein
MLMIAASVVSLAREAAQKRHQVVEVGILQALFAEGHHGRAVAPGDQGVLDHGVGRRRQKPGVV